MATCLRRRPTPPESPHPEQSPSARTPPPSSALVPPVRHAAPPPSSCRCRTSMRCTRQSGTATCRVASDCPRYTRSQAHSHRQYAAPADTPPPPRPQSHTSAGRRDSSAPTSVPGNPSQSPHLTTHAHRQIPRPSQRSYRERQTATPACARSASPPRHTSPGSCRHCRLAVRSTSGRPKSGRTCDSP